MSDFDLDLERDRRLAVRPTPPAADEPGCPSFVGTITTATATIAVGKYLTVNPVSVSGTETEGGAGTITSDGSHAVVVLLLGPGLPVMGDLAICDWVDFRWVTSRDTTTTSGPCGCMCIPTTLAMFSEITPTQQGTLGLSLGWGASDSPIVFTYGLAPVQTLGISAFGLGNPAGNIFFYVDAPEYAWWSPTYIKSGSTYQYLLWVSDCTIYTAFYQAGPVVVYPTFAGGSPSLNGVTWFDTSLTSPVTVDGLFILTSSRSILEVYTAVPASCAPFDITHFSIHGVSGDGSTTAIQLVSESGYGYADYYGACIELDGTGSSDLPSGSLPLTDLE